MTELVLGTAQFGLKYGINNKEEKFKTKKAKEILDICLKEDLNILDTAYAYGESEKILGEYDNLEEFKICSKLPSEDMRKNKNIFEIFNESRQRLNKNYIDYYFLHDLKDINNNKVIKDLIELKKKGLIGKLGVSVYEPNEIDLIIEKDYFEAVQLPLSIFDRRMIKQGKLELLKRNNIDIFIRSIFLQGLFFMDENKLPLNLLEAKKYLDIINKFINENNISLTNLIFSWFKYNDLGDYILMGIDDKKQLLENILNFKKEIDESILNDFDGLIKNIDISDDSTIIDPRKW